MCNLFIIYDPTVDFKISSLRRQTLSRKEIAQYKWSTIDILVLDIKIRTIWINTLTDIWSILCIILYTNQYKHIPDLPFPVLKDPKRLPAWPAPIQNVKNN